MVMKTVILVREGRTMVWLTTLVGGSEAHLCLTKNLRMGGFQMKRVFECHYIFYL
ncbi:hypothetical protein M407DRAFT_246604 [Tulasnella calospora MUT 4182]|uniref:Uncharacterized protein n=1 Tax=Tulasnella calospora MUT 4182 TaxID=1051891 RepID=A0A0C3Q433_9AGAM|nr:hypothetical protein M407DRAFT_246604 [Tulasnella calospora MUT 4182]